MKTLNYKRLHVQSLKDVIDHTLVANNPSFLQRGLKASIAEIDDLTAFLELFAQYPCNCADLSANLCVSCISKGALTGTEPGKCLKMSNE